MLDVQRGSLWVADRAELILEIGLVLYANQLHECLAVLEYKSHFAAEKRVTSNFAQYTVYTVCGIHCTSHIDITMRVRIIKHDGV